MDWCISKFEPEATNCKPCLFQGAHSITGSGTAVYTCTAHCVQTHTTASMVSPRRPRLLIVVAHTLIIKRFVPPQLDTEKSNIMNSENTTLFLVSCFQYIFAGIVLSVGPPFRQPMRNNCKLYPTKKTKSHIDFLQCPSLSQSLRLFYFLHTCSSTRAPGWSISCN